MINIDVISLIHFLCFLFYSLDFIKFKCMEINYLISGLVVLAAILFIIFLIRRNKKDQKDYEQEKINSEIKPEKHGKERA